MENLKKSTTGKRGLVYLGSIPAYMPPFQLKRHFEAECSHGGVERMHLVPAPKKTKKNAEKSTNNKFKAGLFIEGWIEFTNKKDAKSVAFALNGQEVGGNRRSRHYHSLWNVKYLSGFTWDHLMKTRDIEKSTRAQRIRKAISKARKENDKFIQ